MKLWTIKTGECVNTFDEHEDKIWSLAVRGEQVVTGGADSLLLVWKDVTTDENDKKIEEEEEKILKNQELDDAQRAGDYIKAAQLALKLNHPYRLMRLIQDVIAEDPSASVTDKSTGLCSIVAGLGEDELIKTLEYTRDWNCVAKFTIVAQKLLAAIFASYPPSQLKRLDGFKEILEALLPYSDRHIQRVSTLLRGSYFVDYVVNSMALTTEQVKDVASITEGMEEDSDEEEVERLQNKKKRKVV